MPSAKQDPFSSDRLTATWVELAIRIGVLALLLYWAFVLIQPFMTIAIWSIILTVALYPLHERLALLLGGRRRLAAVILTIANLLIIIGPATWLVLGLIDSLRALSDRFDLSTLALPSPPETIRAWPLVGETMFQFWQLASTNLSAAVTKIAPQLRPMGSSVLHIAADAGTGFVQFIIAIVVAGFLFSPAPTLVDFLKMLARRVASERGEEFLMLAGSTIHTVSRGVIGISFLQALLAGLGFAMAGIPGTNLLTSAVLVLGIVQIGPSILILPLIAWSWWSMETTTALLFTLYMVPVNLLDNVLRPIVFGRGLKAPVLVILIGVIGGTIAQGITGLFLGPIVLTVIWTLLVAWVREHEAA